MSEQLLEVRTRTDDATATVAVAGELDLSTLPVFVAAVEEALAADVDVLTIDAGRITFADSSAIHALLRARAAAHDHDVKLLLVNVRGPFERTLGLAGITDVFDVTSN